MYTYTYIYIYIYTYTCIRKRHQKLIMSIRVTSKAGGEPHLGGRTSRPSPPTKSFDFEGFDSSKLLILRGGNSHVRRIL